MADGRVELGVEGLLQAWKRSGYTELWVRFVPRPAADAADVAAEVFAAMEAANGLFDEDDEQAGNFAFAEGPFEAPVGPRAYLACVSRTGYEPAVRDWLNAFARHLEGAGLSGKVGADTRRGDFSAWEVTKRIPLSLLTTFVAYSLLDRSRAKIDRFAWNVDQATTAAVTALVQDTAYPGATTALTTAGGSVQMAPGAVAAAVRRTLARDSVVFVYHARLDPPRFDRAEFNGNGWFTRVHYDPDQLWSGWLAECVETMTLAPARTDLAFAQYAQYLGWNGIERAVPPLPGTHVYHFRANPHLLSSFVPDARGVMVVTDAHLERAHDLSAWTIRPLGHGRHLVRAHDLAAWFADPSGPDPAVLAAARQDFGRMILTVDDIAAHPAPAN